MALASPGICQIGLAAFITDMDGVITQTHALHAYAWKAVFDPFLAKLAEDGVNGHALLHPFDPIGDFTGFVDGRPRFEGVLAFLASRRLALSFGTPADPPEADTVCGLGNAKNLTFREMLETHGAPIYEGSVSLLRRLKAQGTRTAVVSASKNCPILLERAGLLDLFEVIIDGQYTEDHKLRGKPAPDTYLRAASLLGVPASRSAIAEDAVAGVGSGRAGGFWLVVGVDRGVGRQALLEGGADVVVEDLAELDRPGKLDGTPAALVAG
jgi:HAD superfamily hydrolase (TIGR01509 family)